MGEYLEARLLELMGKHPSIGNVIGKGLLYGIEFVKDKSTKEPFPRTDNYTMRVVDECEKNMMFVQSGTGNVKGIAGDMLLIGPAFIVTKEQIDEIVSILDVSISCCS
jgi:4-aminobutyrate aminotransferase-like enzyme